MGSRLWGQLGLLAFLLSGSALAQFSSLVTPADGSYLLFSTTFTERNSSQPTHGKIFRVDAGGVRLVEAREIADREKPCSNPFDLLQVSLSSVGGATAITGKCSCLNGNLIDQYNCVKIDRDTATLSASGKTRDFLGDMWLSRDGKLAVSRTGMGVFSTPSFTVMDVASGNPIAKYGSTDPMPFILRDSLVAANGRILSDDGTVVVQLPAGLGGSLAILRGGVIEQVRPEASRVLFSDGTIDGTGQTILFTARNTASGRSQVRRLNSDATAWTALADGYLPSVSDDGRAVVFVSDRGRGPQAYWIASDGTGERELTNDVEGVAQAILSGDGRVALALTKGGRVLRVEVATGRSEEWIARTPHLDPGFLPLAPGNRVMLIGGGFTAGGNVLVQIDGLPLKMLGVSVSTLDALVPLEVAENQKAQLHVEASSSSAFTPAFDVTASVSQKLPYMLAALHEDWTAVSPEHPAHPGEVVHTFSIGLGPTVPAVSFGQAAPIEEPLARLPDVTGCAEEVFFAGLSPGAVAIYQVDWRVPIHASGTRYTFRCGVAGATIPLGRSLAR